MRKNRGIRDWRLGVSRNGVNRIGLSDFLCLVAPFAAVFEGEPEGLVSPLDRGRLRGDPLKDRIRSSPDGLGQVGLKPFKNHE